MATYTEKMSIIEEKLAKLDAKIEKAVADRKKLVEEYDRVSFLALAETYKLKGKDLFNAIARDHEQMVKFREDGLSDNGETDTVPYESFPHNFNQDTNLQTAR